MERPAPRRASRPASPGASACTTGARYGVFFATDLYQGPIAGSSLTALANPLAARGVSSAEVGLHFALAGLPWTVLGLRRPHALRLAALCVSVDAALALFELPFSVDLVRGQG